MGYRIVEIKNKLSTPLCLINIIVYNQVGGTVGEIQMKVRSVQIPQDINFLDHWLYELRRIYDDTNNSRKADWTLKKKNERIN